MSISLVNDSVLITSRSLLHVGFTVAANASFLYPVCLPAPLIYMGLEINNFIVAITAFVNSVIVKVVACSLVFDTSLFSCIFSSFPFYCYHPATVAAIGLCLSNLHFSTLLNHLYPHFY